MNAPPGFPILRPKKLRIGETLIQMGALNEEQLSAALSAAAGKKTLLGAVLVEMGMVAPVQLARGLAKQSNMPFVDLEASPPNAKWAEVIPERLSRRHHAIAFGRNGDALMIAMADPKDMMAIKEISSGVGKHERHFAATDALERLLDQFHSSAKTIGTLADRVSRDVSPQLPSGAQDAFKDDATSVAKLATQLLEEAIARRATDIHVEPMDNRLAIRLRVDGDLITLPAFRPETAGPLVQRLKMLSNLDISEKRKPQDGRFSFRSAGNKIIDARLATAPSKHGETAVVRLIAAQGQVPALATLGFHERDLADFIDALSAPNGLILLTGPTGSGKTTTLYSALRRLNTGESKIITIEDPIESALDGVVQTQLEDKAGYTFASALRSVLRQDPDVVLIGEIRDLPTVNTALQAAQTGHLVLSTLHTNDSKSAPARLVAMGAEAFMVSSSLRMVVAQRLIKLACVKCSEPHDVSAAENSWLTHALDGAAIPKTVRKGKGCSHCSGTGWFGRRAIHEALTLDHELIDLLQGGATQAFLKASDAKLKGRSLAARAAQLAIDGLTSIEEAQRATGGAQ